MASIRFFVRSKVKQRLAPVYLRYVDGRSFDFWIPTPLKLIPEYWLNGSQKFKDKIPFNDVFTENDKIAVQLRIAALRLYVMNQLHELNQDLSKEWLHRVVDKFFNIREAGAEKLNDYIKRYVDESMSGKRLTKDMKRFSPAYIKNLVSFQTQFNEYQGFYSNKAIKKLQERQEAPRRFKLVDFHDINIDFYNDFVKFFHDKKYSPNTIGKHIKTLKTIMRDAREEGLHYNSETERKAFRSLREEAQTIYLTEKELKKIYDLDLSKISDYEVARDIFLVGCYTAQRFSDYSQILPENIRTLENGRKVIDMKQQKTGNHVVIPVRPELDAILKKYDYRLPRTYEQKLNAKIKEVASMAGLSEMVALEQTKGGLRAKSKVKKCDLVSSHTARRTGCTLMYLAGVNVIDIMKVSGHKSEREFLKYIRVGKEETAINLSNHPYFMGNPLKIAK
ncbi:MAG: site-specific integrase [Deltaproteobacteria bacterium]|nr:site-specific integrase [Deltaproteobacteria bacterium]